MIKNIAYILIGLFASLNLCGQTITERLILTDTQDSIFLKSSRIAFDRLGNYCFEIKKDGQEYFITNNDTIGGFKFIGSTFGRGGNINYTYSYDPKDKPYYYKNSYGTNVYGTAMGKIESTQTSDTRENLAIVTILNNAVYYYINGKLITKDRKKNQAYYGIINDWVAFSENGNVIYFVKQGSVYNLYVNGKLIDSSKFEYTQLAINNNGAYIFAKGKRPKKPIEKYNYMFFIHSTDTILGYVRTVWNYKLKENGAYYYSGDDNGTDYIAINGKLHKDIDKNISNIILVDKDIYSYCFREKGENKINVNGTIYSYDFEQIFFPTLDKLGNFAFYGLKDYYLYKFINGEKVKDPLSKYDVRATPLYISPKGESVHFFNTDDSTYLYRNDSLVFQPISKNTNFKIIPHKEVLPTNFLNEGTENGNSLFYLEYEQQGYFVFNGVFSIPLMPLKYNEQIGSIVAGIFNDYGFFFIQKIDDKKYLININNKTYKELDSVDYFIDDNYFFDDKSLILYGVKDYSFCQFQLNL